MGFFSGKRVSTARLDGKTAVITGCNTGIGKITAKDLYKRGAKVIMACRNLEKANQTLEEIKTECADEENLGQIEVAELDLSSLKSVRECATKLLQDEPRIDILINNAGVMMCPLLRTEEGFEMQIGTNHFGHFLLTMLLLPKIKNSTPARIINVSSIAHVGGKIDFDDINFEKKPYSAYEAYRQSKLANVLFTKELTRRLEEAGIKDVNTYSLHPGVIDTDIGRHVDTTYFKGLRSLFSTVSAFFIKTPEQGAMTTIHCAVSEEAGNETGLYYADSKPTRPDCGVNKKGVAEKLWIESLKLVGLEENYNPFNE